MLNSQIVVMVGLPLSGKSTFIDEVKRNPLGDHYTIVCPDDVRMALYGKEFYGPAEKFVWATVDLMVRSLLIRGQSVIIDATNKTRWERNQWFRIAEEFGVTLQIIHISTTAEECIQRARETNRTEMIEIIQRMADKFEPLTEEERKGV